MDDLISRKAAIQAIADMALGKCVADEETDDNETCEEKSAMFKAHQDSLMAIRHLPSILSVPLEPLCGLLAEMYHCPSSGWPSSGHACHPSCPDEAFEKLCGTDCENYSDAERWKAFLTEWMEGLDDY